MSGARVPARAGDERILAILSAHDATGSVAAAALMGAPSLIPSNVIA